MYPSWVCWISSISNFKTFGSIRTRLGLLGCVVLTILKMLIPWGFGALCSLLAGRKHSLRVGHSLLIKNSTNKDLTLGQFSIYFIVMYLSALTLNSQGNSNIKKAQLVFQLGFFLASPRGFEPLSPE